MTIDPYAPAAEASSDHRFNRVPPADEATHSVGDQELWSESWYLDFVDPAAGVAGYVRLGLYPNQGVAWYWATLVGPDRPLVTLIDHDLALPRQGLEIRSEGLWCEYVVGDPGDHIQVGLEAFALSTDDPTAPYGDLRGDRVPFGLDLDWETDGAAYAYPGVTRYEVPCRVRGQVLLADESIEIDTFGQRDHSWGERDWWTYSWSWMSGRLDDGTRFHGTAVDIGGTPLYGTGYLQIPGDGGGTPTLVGVDDVAHRSEVNSAGLVGPGRWRVGDLDLAVEPVAFSPVGLTAPDGRISRFPRAWCRFRSDDGRAGHGWVEWNQPLGPSD